ncbi:MAG: cation diffusion facilitator family transporter [Bacillota bacterium]|nr:cation diffusion facilitator family transporter [Bacillota bacterium]
MELLFKIFIKDRENVTDANVRRHYGELGGTVGIILNICLFVFKLSAGLLTKSIGIIADAMNNLSDAGSSIITLTSFKMSGKPADNDHPFGHGRIEYISALFVSIAILLMGFELAKSSIEKIIHPEPIEFKWIMIIILAAAILIKTWMFFFNKKIGMKIDSQTMIATSKDSLSDSVATSSVLVGILIAHFANLQIDGLIGLVVSMFIFYTGISTIKQSIAPLLGQEPDPKLVQEIEQMVMAHKSIEGIHELVIHNYGPTRFMVSLHTEVPADADIIEIHDRIDRIEKELNEKFGCEAVIHLDPIETNNAVVVENRAKIKGIVGNISDELSVHDFRMVSGPTHTKLIFDVVVPRDFSMTQTVLDVEIKNRILQYNPHYCAVIYYDREYI